MKRTFHIATAIFLTWPMFLWAGGSTISESKKEELSRLCRNYVELLSPDALTDGHQPVITITTLGEALGRPGSTAPGFPLHDALALRYEWGGRIICVVDTEGVLREYRDDKPPSKRQTNEPHLEAATGIFRELFKNFKDLSEPIASSTNITIATEFWWRKKTGDLPILDEDIRLRVDRENRLRHILNRIVSPSENVDLRPKIPLKDAVATALKRAKDETKSKRWQKRIGDSAYDPEIYKEEMGYRLVIAKPSEKSPSKRWVYDIPFQFNYVGKAERYTDPGLQNLLIDINTGEYVSGLDY